MAPVVLLLLTQCATRAIYSGPVEPVAGTCEPASSGTLTLRADNVEFAPTSGVLVLTGVLDKDGGIHADLIRPGVEKLPYHLTLHATLRAGKIEGEYVTPRCHYKIHLAMD